MKDINEFYLYYEENLKPIIKENAAKLKIFRRIYALSACLILFIDLWLGVWFSSFMPFIVSSPFLFILFIKRCDKFSYPHYRTQLVRGIVKFMGDEYKYRRSDSLGNYSFNKSGIFFERIDKYDVSDIILGRSFGRYINLSFIRGEKLGMSQGAFNTIIVYIFSFFVVLSLLLKYVGYEDGGIFLIAMIIVSIFIILPFFFLIEGRDKGESLTWDIVKGVLFNENKRRRLKIIFEGLFLSMEFNKDFKGHTVGFSRNLQGKFLTLKVPSDMEEVELENSDFMDRFYVYSTGQQEARYLLTPHLMETITGLSIRLEKPMNFSFHSGRLFVTFEQKDLIELGFFDDINSFEAVAELYVSISDIMETADDLDLDVRIWTKQ